MHKHYLVRQWSVWLWWLLLVAVPVLAQPYPDSLWVRRYATTWHDSYVNVQRTPGGNYVAIGTSPNVDVFNSNALLLKYTQAGDLLWVQHFGDTSYVNGACLDRSGGFALAGYQYTRVGSTFPYSYYLARTDSNGVPLWQQTFESSTASKVLNGVAQTSDGGFIGCGYLFSSSQFDMKYLKVDSLGTLVFSRTYGLSNRGDIFNGICSAGNGGVVMTGASASFGQTTGHAFLMKTNTAGDTLWTRFYFVNAATYSEGKKVIRTNDNGYAMAGYSGTPPLGYLVKTDSNGVLQWQRTIPVNIVLWDLVQTPDSGYGVTGESGSIDRSRYLAKVSRAGDVVWQDELRLDDGDTRGYGIANGPDHDFVIVGPNNFASGDNDAFILRTGVDAAKLLLYPNGGQCVTIGTTDTVRWVPYNYLFDPVIIELDRYYPSGNWEPLGGFQYAYQGQVPWLVNGPVSHTARFRLRSTESSSWADTSDADFSIIYAGPDTLWTRNVNENLSQQLFRGICQTPDQGFFCAGQYDTAGAVQAKFRLIKFSASGAQQFVRTYAGGFAEGASALVGTADGGAALFGFTVPALNGIADWRVLRVNASGDTLWTRVFGGAQQELASDIKRTSDNGFIMSGNTRSVGSGPQDIWLVKIDSAGSLQWSSAVGGSDYDFAHEVIATLDGGYLVVGQTSSATDVNGSGIVIKTNATGIPQWQFVVRDTTFDELVAVVQLPSTDIVLLGVRSVTEDDPRDLVLYRLSAAGLFVDSLVVDKGGSERPVCLLAESDGFVIAGTTDAGNGSAFLLKVDTDFYPVWSRDYGTADFDEVYDAVRTSDGGYALAGTRYITNSSAELYRVGADPGAPCPAVTNLTARAIQAFPPRVVLNWVPAQSGFYYVYSTTSINTTLPPPGAPWVTEGLVYGVGGTVTTFSDFLFDNPLDRRYAVTLLCP